MKITDYALHISREDVAAFYELRVKSEERKASVMVTLIMFASFFVLPLILVRLMCTLFQSPEVETWMVEIVLAEALVIVVLALCNMSNAFRAGRMFRLLRKNKDTGSMLRYIDRIGEGHPWFRIAYIMHFSQYRYAYINEDNMLVIVYEEDGWQQYYEVYDYRILGSRDCENAILVVDGDGVYIVDVRA